MNLPNHFYNLNNGPFEKHTQKIALTVITVSVLFMTSTTNFNGNTYFREGNQEDLTARRRRLLVLLNLYYRRKTENSGIHALPCPHTSNTVWEGWNHISFPLFLMNFNLPGKHRNFELKNGRGRNHQAKPDPPFCCIRNKISTSLTRPAI